MNNKKYIYFFLLFFVTSSNPWGTVKAQDGILSEISYLYLNKLIAAAKENYPRIKNYNSQIKAAKNDLSGIKISWLEPFSFQYVSRSNDASSNLVNVTTADVLNGYQFGISVSPGSLLAKPSQIKRAKEQVKMVEYELEEYYLTLETEVKTRYFTYLQAQKSIAAANSNYLDAENTLNIVKTAYQKAEVTLQDFNDANITYNTAYTNKLSAETALLTAKASLEELTVQKLEEIK